MNRYLTTFLAASLALASSAICFSADASSAPSSADAVITAKAAKAGQSVKNLSPGDVLVYTGKSRASITDFQKMSGDNAGLELFIYIDDSTRSAALGTKLPELKEYIRSLPATTKVGIGYMRNGSYSLEQEFTSDHDKAAEALRLPQSIPGINGSPYFALSYLVKHWPSETQAPRKAVLMLTDGVDRYYDNLSTNDPYVDAAIKDSQHFGVLVYSIYMSGQGTYPAGSWGRNMGQSRLEQVSQATGGEAYFQGFTTPISLAPYLKQLDASLNNQYRIRFVASHSMGLQQVEFRSELPGVKVVGPKQVRIRPSGS